MLCNDSQVIWSGFESKNSELIKRSDTETSLGCELLLEIDRDVSESVFFLFLLLFMVLESEISRPKF